MQYKFISKSLVHVRIYFLVSASELIYLDEGVVTEIHFYCRNIFWAAAFYIKLKTERKSKFPVVIFSHGIAGCRTSYSIICTELASQGLIVAAMEHRYYIKYTLRERLGITRLFSVSANFYLKMTLSFLVFVYMTLSRITVHWILLRYKWLLFLG